MNVEEKEYASQLLYFLMCSEQIAARCASRQVVLAPNEKMRKFFTTQASQERQHTFIFDKASRWIRPRGYKQKTYAGLLKFESKLSNALDRKDLAESIVAQQLLFEALGEITLEKVSSGIEDRGFGFKRIRKTILNQERTHHKFGQKHVARILNAPQFDAQIVGRQCKEYLEIIDSILTEMEPVLLFYNQSVDIFYQQLIKELPESVQAEL